MVGARLLAISKLDQVQSQVCSAREQGGHMFAEHNTFLGVMQCFLGGVWCLEKNILRNTHECSESVLILNSKNSFVLFA
jgi:hypothetical protein